MEETRKHGWFRLTIAAALVIGGLVTIAPSFDADSDGDGAADVTEINDLGTDPAKPDLFDAPAVAGTKP